MKRKTNLKKIKVTKIEFIISVFCIFANILAFYCDESINLGTRRLAFALMISIILAYPLGLLISKFWVLIDKLFSYKSMDLGKECFGQKKYLMLSGILMLVVWFPTYLAFYPGLFTNDVVTQLSQSLGSYNTHHPLLHTLILKAFAAFGTMLGDINIGVAVFCLAQLVALDIVVVMSLKVLLEFNAGKIYYSLATIFYAFLPVFPILGITTTKDVPFTMCFTLYLISIVQLIKKSEDDVLSKEYVSIVVFGVLSMLFRHNATVVILAVDILLLIQYRKTNLKKVLTYCFVVTLISYMVINSILVAVTAAKTDGNHNEMLSVPYQQLSRVYVYKYDELSEEERNEILRYIPLAGTYDPILSDLLKKDALADEDIFGFAKLYIKLLVRYPYEYLESFIWNTMGYWYIGDTTAARTYERSSTSGTVGYMYLYMWEELGVKLDSKLPALRDWYIEMFAANKYLSIPGYRYLFVFATYLWIIIFAHVNCLTRKKTKYVSIYIAIELLFFTLLFGPCTSLRYAFPLFMCMPFCIAIKCKTE